ncbi:MAG: hypothetical protein Q8N45_06610 [Anaerolineales bacterium]|nr:hypothetical protein [Anaerolineales bacterium]
MPTSKKAWDEATERKCCTITASLSPLPGKPRAGTSVAALSLGRAFGAPIAPWLYGFGFPAVAAGAVVFNVFALLTLSKMGKK